MKKIILSMLVAASAVTFYSCSSKSEKEVDEARVAINEDIKSEKENVKQDLIALRNDIDDRLDKVSKKLEQASDKSKQELEEIKQNLDKQKEDVQETLNEVEYATDSTWVQIKENTRAKADEVKKDFDDLRDKLAKAIDSK